MKIRIVQFLLILFVANSLPAQKLKPTEKMALLTGTVTNFQNKRLAGEILIFADERTKKTFEASTNDLGNFEILVPAGATYALKYKNFTLDMDYTKMEIPPDANATYEVQVKIQPPKEFVLDNVYFDTGKSSLKPASYKALNDLVQVLKLKKQMKIEIQGHTDNVGGDEANKKLSQARADEVRKYLLGKGIAPERVVATGYGATRPIADNSSEQGRAKNRRTSLKVLNE